MGYTINSGNIIYLGSFRVPKGIIGSSSFEYSEGNLAYNPNHNSLFMGGFAIDLEVAEISIPALATGSIDDLNEATILQSFTNGLIDSFPISTYEGSLRIGALAVQDDTLLVGIYEYFDAENVQQHALIKILDNNNLATSLVSGAYIVGDLGGALISVYGDELPPDQTGSINSTHIFGGCGLSIITRTSFGPSLFGVNPATFVTGINNSADTLLYYPQEHPFPNATEFDGTSLVWNILTAVNGAILPTGSDTVLFWGCQGTGELWYGDNGDFPGLFDPVRNSKGYHAYPYIQQIWAFEKEELLQIKSGIINPWEATYRYWKQTPPHPYNDDSGHFAALGGLTYDATGHRIFVTQLYQEDAYPIIHVYTISGATSSGESGYPPNSSGTTMRYISQYSTSGILEHLFRQQSFNKPIAWAALCTSDINNLDDGSSISEVSHNFNYIRIPITGNNIWSQPIISGNAAYIRNNEAITFPQAAQPWGLIKSIAILDNSGDGIGNLLCYNNSISEKFITKGDTYKIGPSGYTITIR